MIRMHFTRKWQRDDGSIVTDTVFEVAGEKRFIEFDDDLTFDEAKQRVQAVQDFGREAHIRAALVQGDLAAVEGGKSFAMPKLGRMT